MSSEKDVAEREIVHKIVSEINNVGITDRQRWLLIYSLALELENVGDMQELCQFIKDLKADSIFLTGKVTSFSTNHK